MNRESFSCKSCGASKDHFFDINSDDPRAIAARAADEDFLYVDEAVEVNARQLERANKFLNTLDAKGKERFETETKEEGDDGAEE